jgi:hypothetical protein
MASSTMASETAVAHGGGDQQAAGVAQQHHGGGGLGALEDPVHGRLEEGVQRVGRGQGLGDAEQQHQCLVGDSGAAAGRADGRGACRGVLEGDGLEVVERAQHVHILHVLGEDHRGGHVLPVAEAAHPSGGQVHHLGGGALHGVGLADREGVLSEGDDVARGEILRAL